MRSGDRHTIELLVDYGVNINRLDDRHNTPLHCLVINYDKFVSEDNFSDLYCLAELFLKNGAKLNLANYNNRNVLKTLVNGIDSLSIQVTLMDLFVRYGAQLNIVYNDCSLNSYISKVPTGHDLNHCLRYFLNANKKKRNLA